MQRVKFDTNNFQSLVEDQENEEVEENNMQNI